MTPLVDSAFFALNAVLILIEGYSDYNYRGIPLYVATVHVVLSVVAVATRIVLEGFWFVLQTHWVVPLVLIPLVLVYLHTGLIGEGDLVVLVASGLTSPYVPAGYFAKLPIPLPIAMVVSSLYPLYRYLKTTSVVYIKGIGRARARVRYAVDLKRGLLKNEHPIYIDGYGLVQLKRLGNPESIGKVLESVPDYALVYTVPQYPFVYYYSLSFVTMFLVTTIVSVLVSLVTTYVP